MIHAALLAAALTVSGFVDPFIGTSGTPIGGPIDTFPGADVPFGMVQWSPDTPSQNAGGGYDYGDKAITGFSLTHLSGPGCSVFGDFAMLPTTGAIDDPAHAKQPFSHANEVEALGYYAVALGDPSILAQLSVTPRTGLGVFTFPATTQANILISPSSNQAGVTASQIHVIDSQDIEASASSGYFCGMPDRYTVYYTAHFDRPFSASGTWGFNGSANGGAWLRFDTTTNHVVRVQVALSFVDAEGARRNLAAEARSWDIVNVRNNALASWESVLSRISVSGAPQDVMRQFYTALYHTMLHPNVIDDADGRYRGFDGKIHTVARGHHEYANYSDWDIYRTEIPLIALLVPHRTSDMMQSLVDAYAQSGWLPRWPVVNQPSSVMGGDSPDAILAGAYAFGARDFDARTALEAMEKGASKVPSVLPYGWYLERPEVAEYLKYGYIPNTHTTSVSPVPNGASETLEYALDDASIAALGRDIGRRSVWRTYAARGQNWANLFDTSQQSIEPRDAQGAFEHTPITDSGQSGFQEGNAAQYTWMVPQDLPALIAAMGGRDAANSKLDEFFTQLNADQNKPHAWMGNEPSIGSPYVYLSSGQPWKTQQIVRTVITTLYTDRPDGIPGNDDLGTMSAWYVWSALGLYPQMPAVRRLDIGSPIFTHATIRVPHGPTIQIDARNASPSSPYVRSLRIDGRATQHTWLDLPMHGTTRLAFDLGATPNTAWGTAPADAPPALDTIPVTLPPSSYVTFSEDAKASIAPGATDRFTIVAKNGGSRAERIAWSATTQDGMTLAPASGTVDVPANGSASFTVRGRGAQAGLYDVSFAGTSANGAKLMPAIALVRVARPGAVLPLAWIANRFDNTVMPYDLRTRALGARVAVGQEPRDGVLTPGNARYFVADRASKSVSVVDTATMRQIAAIPVGTSPNGTAISRDGAHVWVANYDDNTISEIDTRTLAVVATIPVGKNPRYIAIEPNDSMLYVSNQSDNTVTPVDLRTNKPLAPIAVGQRPTGIALSPDGKHLYVANNATENVTVIDTATARVVTSIPASVEAQMVAVSPDGSFAYVPNFSTITVTPIDLRTNTALPDIRVGGQPFDVEWLPDGSAAIATIRQDNALVWIGRNGHVERPQFIGAWGSYTIAMPQ